jgi:hypothetical protein
MISYLTTDKISYVRLIIILNSSIYLHYLYEKNIKRSNGTKVERFEFFYCSVTLYLTFGRSELLIVLISNKRKKIMTFEGVSDSVPIFSIHPQTYILLLNNNKKGNDTMLFRLKFGITVLLYEQEKGKRGISPF